MEESTRHKMVIGLLKRVSCLKCTLSLVLNMIFTLTLEA